METLYRKYRPQRWSELVGQNHVRLVLEGELSRGRLAHAFLFAGPRGVGKTTIARILAKAVNCLARAGGSEPCNHCEACQEISSGRSMDVMEIDAASHTGVDHVREHIINNARFAPTRWAYKVFIIDEAHMLSASAFNALLKTLEEPPAHALFILATTELHKVPATIVSRCQRFDFKPLNLEELIALMKSTVQAEKIKVALPVFEAVARAALGSPRDALTLLAQVLALGGKEITLEQASLVLPESHRAEARELIGFLAGENVRAAVDQIGKLTNEGVELETFTKELIEILREILLEKLAGRSVFLSDFSAETREAVGRWDLVEVSRAIRSFETARVALGRVEIVELPLELAAVELCLVRAHQGIEVIEDLSPIHQ